MRYAFSHVLDADKEQADYEEWIRRGTPHGQCAPVITAKEMKGVLA